MLRKLCSLILLSAAFMAVEAVAQTTPTITVDFSGAADTSVTITNISRNGNVCGSSGGERCIVFNIILNAGSDVLNFDVKNPGPPGGAFYQIDCATPTSLNTPVCITGKTTVSISFCKSGNDQPNYIISASRNVKASDDLNLRQGCSGTMSVTGLQPASVVWTSIFPGAQGDYNGYLSPATGALSTTVTPTIGAPAYIDYKVTGNQNTVCTGAKSDTVRVYTSPPLTVALSPANPVICSGASVLLTATPSGGLPGYTYLWSTGETTATKTATTPGTYTVWVSDQLSGCPPAMQQVTVGAAATPAAPTAPGTTICSGTTATLNATAPGGTYRWYDAASGGNLLFTGANYTTSALTFTTTYYVETLLGCVSTRTAVTVSVTPLPAAPTVSTAVICAGSSATLTATGPGGTYQWYNAAVGGTMLFTGTTFTSPSLTANTTYYVESIVNGCAGPRTAVAVTVTPLPAAPTAPGTTICSGTTATLAASGSGGTYEWFDAPSGGSLLVTSTNYTTPVLNSSTTYYVQSTVNGCTGPRTAVTVSVNPPPGAPTVAGTTICAGSVATLTATGPGGTYRWFDASSGGTQMGSGSSFTTPALTSTTTYYVETLLGCLSPRTPVTVSVTPLPAAPTASGASICAGNTATLVASGPGGSYEWFNVATGGTALATSSVYITPSLNSNTTFYVQTTVNGCAGPRTAVSVTVTPLPPAPTAAGTTICAGNSTTLNATAPGGNYQWYDAATGGSLLGTGTSFLTPVLTSSTTFYVQTVVNGCAGPRTAVTVTVNPIIDPEFAYSSGTYCKSGTTVTPPPTIYTPDDGTFSASSPLLKFADPATGTIDVTATIEGTYRITFTNNSPCPRASFVDITITSVPIATFQYASSSFCVGSTNPLPVFTGLGSAGVFTSDLPGLEFVNASTGEINLSTSSPGTYTVTNTISPPGCTASDIFTVTIVGSPVAPTVTGLTTICEGSTTTLTASGSGGTYSWFNTATGGNALQTGPNFLTPALNFTTAYYVQANVGGCDGPRKAITVTVNPTPATPTAAGTTVCQGSTATLVATGPGGDYEWFDTAVGGSPVHSGAIFTTPALNADKTYFLQTKINGCPSPRRAVSVLVTPTPSAPTAPGLTVCVGNVAVLTASASGGLYRWYDAISGGNLLTTGPNFTTPTLNATISYYVESVISGCPGPRTTVTVIVTPTPSAPTVQSVTICAGSTATLTATAPGGTYSWYDAPTGGNIVGTGPSYTTGILNATTTYYVETMFGCLSPRTAVTVNVNPIPVAPTVAAATVCSGNTATLTATGPGGIYQWFNVISGGTILATNPSFTTPVLTTSTTYYVQAVVNGCTGPRTAVAVSVTPIPPAPTASGVTICTGNSATLNAIGTGGTFRWYDASTGGNLLANTASFTTPVLNTNAVYYVETFLGCLSARTAVNVTVVPLPAAPTASGTTVCSGSTASLTAVAPGGTYQWFDAPIGGTPLVTAATFNTPELNSTTTYYVQSVINGCSGPRTAVTVNVTPIPGPPTVTAPIICVGNSTTLTATGPGGNYQWFDAATGGNLLQTGSTFITPVLNTTTTFYVQTTVNGCTSSRAAVVVTAIPIINPEFQYSSGTYCKSGPSITAPPAIFTPGGGTFTATSGLVFANSMTGEINVAATPLGTYTITFTNNSQCPRSSTVNITITNAPDATFSYNTTSFCLGNTNASPIFPGGASAGVFTSSPGLSFLNTSTGEINLSASTPGTYIVVNTIAANGGCAAAIATYSVTINPSPLAPVLTTASICAGNTATLGASGSTGVYQWFDAATGGNLLFTGNAFTTPLLNTTTTYFVQAVLNGCTSNRVATTVTVTPIIDPEFEYSSGTYCKSGTLITPPPAIYTIGGGVFSSTAGLVFKDRTTGEIDVSACAIGTYIVSFTNNSPCPRVTTSTVTITNAPDASFSFTGTYCQNGVNPFPNFGNGASPGLFTSPSPALVFVSPSTGEIDLSLSSPGTYVITNTIAANGGCAAATFTSTITIAPTPPIPAASNLSICAGSTATLVITDPSGNYQWFSSMTGGTALGTGNTFTTPALSATSRYYVQNTNGLCTSTRKEIIVTVNSIPVAPVLLSNSPVCIGNPIVLGAGYVQGAIYSWKGPDNFSSNLQNPIINAASLQNAGIYTLTISVNGCTSASASVDVKINELPVALAGTDQTLCASSNAVNLTGTISGTSTGGFWSTNGSGTFSPSNTSLNAVYIPSAADKTNLKVLLTLTSVNNQSCAPAISTMAVNFVPIPVVNAGIDQAVCASSASVALSGQVTGATGGVWSTNGDGRFTTSADIQTSYLPGTSDIKNGSVKLQLTSSGNGLCSAVTDELLLTINPLPQVSAGEDLTILQNEKVTLQAKSSTPNVRYVWTPEIGLSDYSAKNPIFTGTSTQTYTVTIINEWGCISTDEVLVTVLEPITIPNTFTPNGDGTNDVWNIAKLADYPDAVVHIYNRYGNKLFYSEGYDAPWDGTYQGEKVPAGTYYYVIDTKFPGQVYSGYILVIQ